MSEQIIKSPLLDGGSWYAAVEEKVGASGTSDDETRLRYGKVIAWESDGQQLTAWINGNPPVRSDQLSKSAPSWILNHFTQELPEGAEDFNWA